MKRARRPLLHPNCRSTLIPVVDLIDPKTGEKIKETAERPAQNADGTYSQVAAKTTFKDYFESQPETFQREWLGEKRFELWKSGKLKFEDLAKPATTYRATPADLTPPTEKPRETAASDDKTSNGSFLADAIRAVGGEKEAAEILRNHADSFFSAPTPEETRRKLAEFYAEYEKERENIRSLSRQAATLKTRGHLEEAQATREKTQDLSNAAVEKLNRKVVDYCLPKDFAESPNRKAMRAKLPQAIGYFEGTKYIELSDAHKKEVEKALDFVGRLMDNIGVDARFWDGVHFYDLLLPRGFYAHDGWDSDEYQIKFEPRTIGLSHKERPSDFGVVAARELAHAVEGCSPHLLDALVDYYVNITTAKNGKRRAMRKIPHSAPPEYYRPAKITIPTEYALRTYNEQNDGDSRENATEIFSVWRQYLYRAPFALANDHTDYFLGVLGVLKDEQRRNAGGRH